MKLPDPTFFIDRCLGNRIIAQRLRGIGVKVEIHDDHFAADAADAEWLAEVGRRGWIILTKDKHFRSRRIEITAIARSNAQVFQLTAGGIQGEAMAEIFARSARKIARVAESNPSPFIATVTRSGSVRIVLTSRNLKRFK